MTAPSLVCTATRRVSHVQALEILDSRGHPTLQVTVTLAGGLTATAGVPSGASTGSGEAAERRDGDLHRYRGLGVRDAAEAVQGPIADRLRGQDWRSLAEIDAALIDLDGTPDKARLGANAIVGTSMACARALACAEDRDLWDWLTPPGVAPQLPVPHFNVINGGVHARNALDYQEFMIAPLGAPRRSGPGPRCMRPCVRCWPTVVTQRGLATKAASPRSSLSRRRRSGCS
jgi:enolase